MKTNRVPLIASSTVYAVMIAINAAWVAVLLDTATHPTVWANVLAIAIIGGVWGYTIARLTGGAR